MIKAMTFQQEWDWIRQRSWCIQSADSVGVVSYDKDGKIIAAIVADNFTAVSCCVHIAIDNPMAIRQGLLEATADYLFNGRGLNRVFGMVPSDNEKAIRFDTRIGFREIARIPNACNEGVDYVIMGMERDECRWLKDKEEAA